MYSLSELCKEDFWLSDNNKYNKDDNDTDDDSYSIHCLPCVALSTFTINSV